MFNIVGDAVLADFESAVRGGALRRLDKEDLVVHSEQLP